MNAVFLSEEATRGTTLAPLLQVVDPESVKVAAVMKDGKVIASLGVLRLTHFEGVWIDPEHRNAGTIRALLEKAWEAANEWPEKWVLAGASDERMKEVCERLGGVRVPMDCYVIRLGEG